MSFSRSIFCNKTIYKRFRTAQTMQLCTKQGYWCLWNLSAHVYILLRQYIFCADSSVLYCTWLWLILAYLAAIIWNTANILQICLFFSLSHVFLYLDITYSHGFFVIWIYQLFNINFGKVYIFFWRFANYLVKFSLFPHWYAGRHAGTCAGFISGSSREG